jgi:hypothetical protein
MHTLPGLHTSSLLIIYVPHLFGIKEKCPCLVK